MPQKKYTFPASCFFPLVLCSPACLCLPPTTFPHACSPACACSPCQVLSATLSHFCLPLPPLPALVLSAPTTCSLHSLPLCPSIPVLALRSLSPTPSSPLPPVSLCLPAATHCASPPPHQGTYLLLLCSVPAFGQQWPWPRSYLAMLEGAAGTLA